MLNYFISYKKVTKAHESAYLFEIKMLFTMLIVKERGKNYEDRIKKNILEKPGINKRILCI